jgi:hypothetical protein
MVMRRGIALTMCALALSGCAGNKAMYAGNHLPDSELSIVRGTGVTRSIMDTGYTSILITQVDGKDVKPPSLQPNSVKVLPGHHQFDVGAYNLHSKSTAHFEADLLAGHTYEIRYQEAEDADGFKPIIIREAWLQDTGSNQRVLTIEPWSFATMRRMAGTVVVPIYMPHR